jgi:hypothetical protein
MWGERHYGSRNSKKKVGKLIYGDGYKMRTIKSGMIFALVLKDILLLKKRMTRLNGTVVLLEKKIDFESCCVREGIKDLF